MDRSASRSSGSAAAPAGGADPLVINLCASMTALTPDPQVLARLQAYRIYQLVRTEDGRPRHRLRVGFFSDPRDAEALLTDLRQHYPTAFVALACADDLRYARAQDLRNSSSTPSRAASARPVAAPQPPPAPSPTAALVRTSTPARSVATAAAVTPRGREEQISAGRDRSATPAAAQSLELGERRSDETVVYAIQLVRSHSPLNVAALPRLDIFSAFKLYTVKLQRDAKIIHALRLGFFRERVSAEQVARYLKDHFPTRELIRVAAEEQRRYASARAAAPAAPGSSRQSASDTKVIRLSDAREQPREGVVLRPPPATGAPGRLASPETPVASQPAPKAVPPARSRSEKTLNELLLEEARQVALSQSGIRRLPATTRASLLTRLVVRIRGSSGDRS